MPHCAWLCCVVLGRGVVVVVGSRGSVLVRYVLQHFRMTAMLTPWGHRVKFRLGLGFVQGLAKWLQ